MNTPIDLVNVLETWASNTEKLFEPAPCPHCNRLGTLKIIHRVISGHVVYETFQCNKCGMTIELSLT